MKSEARERGTRKGAAVGGADAAAAVRAAAAVGTAAAAAETAAAGDAATVAAGGAAWLPVVGLPIKKRPPILPLSVADDTPSGVPLWLVAGAKASGGVLLM